MPIDEITLIGGAASLSLTAVFFLALIINPFLEWALYPGLSVNWRQLAIRFVVLIIASLFLYFFVRQMINTTIIDQLGPLLDVSGSNGPVFFGLSHTDLSKLTGILVLGGVVILLAVSVPFSVLFFVFWPVGEAIYRHLRKLEKPIRSTGIKPKLATFLFLVGCLFLVAFIVGFPSKFSDAFLTDADDLRELAQATKTTTDYRRSVENDLEQVIKKILDQNVEPGKSDVKASVDLDSTSKQIKRLSVAVLVDGTYIDDTKQGYLKYRPRTEAWMETLAKKISQEINFDGSRGDKLNVVNMLFVHSSAVKKNGFEIPKLQQAQLESYNATAIASRTLETRLQNSIVDLLEHIVGLGKVRSAVTAKTSSKDEVLNLSVAVLIDGSYQKPAEGDPSIYKPRVVPEMELIAALVRSTVGFSADRGDSVDVVNMRFANDTAISSNQTSTIKRASISDHLEQKIIVLLSPFLGKGNVRASVSVELDNHSNIQRQRISVILNDRANKDVKTKLSKDTPWTKTEMDLLAKLIRAATGFDADRGDTLDIVNTKY